jgi:hypothetical protein
MFDTTAKYWNGLLDLYTTNPGVPVHEIINFD